jgi:superfamily II DNA helicase RecQ
MDYEWRWRAFRAPPKKSPTTSRPLTRGLLQALRLIEALDGRFGLTTLADVLAGVDTDKVLRHGLHQLREFGTLRRAGRRGAFAALDDLKSRKLVRTEEVEALYLVMRITDAGRNALVPTDDCAPGAT